MSPLRETDATRARAWFCLALGRVMLIVCTTLGVTLLNLAWMGAARLTGRHGGPVRALQVRIIQLWGRCCLRWAGWRVRVRGPAPPPGSLIAPNHTGYADTIAMAAAAPCFFVPKAEVAGWPVIGWILRSFACPFVSRRGGRKMRQAVDAVAERLGTGQSVCVFLEGTSGSGAGVLPFSPALLEPALRAGAPVTPAAIRWRAVRPGVDVAEDVAYWREEHVFGPHIWRLLGLRGIEGEIIFGEPVNAKGWDRKALARELRERVAALGGLEKHEWRRGDEPAHSANTT